MKFSPDSTFFKITTTLSQFIVLNICYLIVCIPVITIGSATSALFSVTMRYADYEQGYLVMDFFKQMKDNWKDSSFIFLSLIFPIVALSYSGIFWIKLNSSIISMLVGIIALSIAFYLFLACIYGLALIGRFDASFKQTLQNALYLPLVEPFRSLLFVLIAITIAALITLIPGLRFIWALFGFSFTSYCFAFFFLAIFKKYED